MSVSNRDKGIRRLTIRSVGGWVVGMLAAVLSVVPCARGGTFTNLQVLWSFPLSNATAFPISALLESTNGFLYGTTYGGSSNTDFGSVFRIAKNGAGFSMLRKFVESDGGALSASLIETTNGLLYSTAFDEAAFASGSVFRMAKDGTGFGTVHHFTGETNDGAFSAAALLQASDGMLYGTTQLGGVEERGVVFRMNVNGSNFTVLHSFTADPDDGTFSVAPLVEGTNGMLYGTTFSGGPQGILGTVFRLNKNGSGFSVIHAFAGGSDDGAIPYAPLMKGTNGLLYGTTTSDGAAGYGVVFSITHAGDFAVVHHFGSVANDGQIPYATLVQGPDGALYGTTSAGGLFGQGTVFRMNYDGGNYGVVLSFTGTNGGSPQAALISGSDGALYGTCKTGGPLNRGTVFKLMESAYEFNVLLPPQSLGAGGWRVRGQGVPNRVYSLQYSTNLASPNAWFPLGSAPANSAGSWQFDDPAVSKARFYRTKYP